MKPRTKQWSKLNIAEAEHCNHRGMAQINIFYEVKNWNNNKIAHHLSWMLVQQETHYHQRQQLVNTIDTSCDLLGRLGLFERDAFIRVQHPQRIPEASLPENVNENLSKSFQIKNKLWKSNCINSAPVQHQIRIPMQSKIRWHARPTRTPPCFAWTISKGYTAYRILWLPRDKPKK